MKICKVCGKRKPKADFNKHPSTKDGLYLKCKACVSEYNSQYLAKNRKRLLAYKQRWNKSPKGREVMAQSIQRLHYKHIARSRIAQGIREGKIIPPLTCTNCEDKSKLEAHHPDYSKPYDVEWLCIPCHHKLHRKS